MTLMTFLYVRAYLAKFFPKILSLLRTFMAKNLLTSSPFFLTKKTYPKEPLPNILK